MVVLQKFGLPDRCLKQYFRISRVYYRHFTPREQAETPATGGLPRVRPQNLTGFGVGNGWLGEKDSNPH
jgi:hypothetical protein